MENLCNCHKHAKDELVKQQRLYDASIIFIDNADPTNPLKREQYWRHTFKTLVPHGLNVSESV